MGKPRNEELNFLYMDDKYQTKGNKNKKKSTEASTARLRKNNTKSRKKTNKEDAPFYTQDNKFNFDNEIIIGVTKIPDNKKKDNIENKSKNKKKRKNNTRTSNIYSKSENNKKVSKQQINNVKQRKKLEENKKNTKKSSKKVTKKQTKKSRIIKGIVKWTILFSALIASIIFFMMTPLFNILEVQVVNNEKISSETIISLSKITLGENIYKISSKAVKQNIKQNPYVENVEVNRKLPNKIVISVKERKTTYMLEYAEGYAYINNQGYILEISEEKLETPIIIGYKTPQEQIKAGNRLYSEDLEKLETVLKIMESASSNGVSDLITKINIENKQNYTLILESEKKVAYIGDASNLSNRMLYLKAIIEEAKGIEGEIFVNANLNKSGVYFRKKE